MIAHSAGNAKTTQCVGISQIALYFRSTRT
jgi:hypothetical protein